jgi:hypothetical protein
MNTAVKKESSSTNNEGVLSLSSSMEKKKIFQWIKSRTRNSGDEVLASATTKPRSNWETHLFEEVIQLVFQMSRLPSGHDFHLDEAVARRAADVLGTINSNSLINAPRVINEEGDTVLFTWEEGDLKKYLCIDGDDVELRVRKPGTQFSTFETLSNDGVYDVSALLSALGAGIKSGSVI